ncbi:MAG: NADH-quinone oxidoreductase subunit L [Coriobacteriia bacterium]|nr:NADH-quinone oxidoreductase subunit L [Coriobacteriia bacterium]
MLATPVFLVLFPIAVAGVLLVVRNSRARRVIVGVSTVTIAAGSIVLAVQHLDGVNVYAFSGRSVDFAILSIDATIALSIILTGIRNKKYMVGCLAFVWMAIICWLNLGPARAIRIANPLYVDRFSVIMALIIGIVGGAVCVYSIGYMRTFAAQSSDVLDRSRIFFATGFVFLAAMFGVVFSNDLNWLCCSWQVATMCTFLLISYTQTPGAITNAFRQLTVSLLGGVALVIAVVYIGINLHTLELSKFLLTYLPGTTVALPALLLAFAGMTQTAQMPFHGWLLHSTEAPTPISALLQSSTIVMAGAFLLIRISPVLGGSPSIGWNIAGLTVQLVGGLTFLVCSVMAIGQSNISRMLTCSTIATMGLITVCAAIGKAEILWSAIFLVIFHAVAKPLLFLCVGAVERHMVLCGIDGMDVLFAATPSLNRFMSLGMGAMLLAPFLLFTKWVALSRLAATYDALLVLILLAGGAAASLLWIKLLARTTAVSRNPTTLDVSVSRVELFAIAFFSTLTLGVVVSLPFVSIEVVVPYLAQVYGIVWRALPTDNLLIAAAMTVPLVVIFVGNLQSRGALKCDLLFGAESVALITESRGDDEKQVERPDLGLVPYLPQARLSAIGTTVSVIMLVCGLDAAVRLAVGVI